MQVGTVRPPSPRPRRQDGARGRPRARRGRVPARRPRDRPCSSAPLTSVTSIWNRSAVRRLIMTVKPSRASASSSLPATAAGLPRSALKRSMSSEGRSPMPWSPIACPPPRTNPRLPTTCKPMRASRSCSGSINRHGEARGSVPPTGPGPRGPAGSPASTAAAAGAEVAAEVVFAPLLMSRAAELIQRLRDRIRPNLRISERHTLPAAHDPSVPHPLPGCRPPSALLAGQFPEPVACQARAGTEGISCAAPAWRSSTGATSILWTALPATQALPHLEPRRRFNRAVRAPGRHRDLARDVQDPRRRIRGRLRQHAGLRPRGCRHAPARRPEG